MSQYSIKDGILTSSSGVALEEGLNLLQDAISSGYSGTARPSYLAAGGTWVDTTETNSYKFYFYDGTNDNLVFSVNPLTSSIAMSGDRSSDATGTVDSIVVSFDNPVESLTDGLKIYVRSSGQNTSSAPSISVDGLSSVVITRNGGQPLTQGDTGNSGNVMILEYNLSTGYFELLNPVSPIETGTMNLAEEVASGAAGAGSSIAGVNTRNLNTVYNNSISGASLSSNVVTLTKKGRYLVSASAPSFTVRQNNIILDITGDITSEIIGTSGYSTANGGQTFSTITNRYIDITSDGIVNLTLKHYTRDAQASNGLGIITLSGDVGVFATMTIEKVY